MLDHGSKAFVEAKNGLLRQAKCAAHGCRTADNASSTAPVTAWGPAGLTVRNRQMT
jgi:hypothetical protein